MIDYYKIKDNLDSLDLLILSEYINCGPVSYEALAKKYKSNRTTIKKKILNLIKKGYLKVEEGRLQTIVEDTYKRKNGSKNRVDYSLKKVTINEMVILDKIMDYWQYGKIRVDDMVFISYRQLSKECGLNYDTIKKTISRMEKRGLVVKKRIGKITYLKPLTFVPNGKLLSPMVNFCPQPLTFVPEIYNIYKNKKYSIFYFIHIKEIKYIGLQPIYFIPVKILHRGLNMKIEKIIKDVKTKHKEKPIKNITDAIVFFKNTIGSEIPITPMDKNKLKKIIQFCKENELDFKKLIECFNDEWNNIISLYRQGLSYLGVPLDRPSISVLYDSKVLIYLHEKMKEKRKEIVQIKEEAGFKVAYYSDGTKKIIKEDI